MSLKVLVHTLGCAKNEFDSSVLAAMLESAGATLVEDAAEADIVVLNTCGFILPAIEESIETARALREAMKPDARLVIAGCLVNYARDRIRELIPEGDVFLRIEEEDEVVEMVAPGRARPRAGGLCLAFSLYRTAQDGSLSVYLKIAEGCSNGCRYCAIPRIRGRQRSFPHEAIIAEAERLARTGAREFVLVAQDLSTYGLERGERDALERLVRELAERLEAASGDGSFWIRLLYMNPDNVSLARLKVLFSIPHVVPYFDIPVQSGSTAVLRRMGRRKSAHEIAELFEGIRARFPESFIRTSLMIGFPGETDDEFAETLDFVERVEPDYCAVFPYSPMPATPACEDSLRVSDDVIAWRVRELSELVDRISFARLFAREGSDIEVLVEGLAPRSDSAGRIKNADDALVQSMNPDRNLSDSRASGRPGDSRAADIRSDHNAVNTKPEPHAAGTCPGSRHCDSPHDSHTADVQHVSWVATGRHIGQAPEIDGQVFLIREKDARFGEGGSDRAAKRAPKKGHASGATLAKGAIIRARLVRVEGFDCYAIPLAFSSTLVSPSGTDAGTEYDPHNQPADSPGSTESDREPKRSAFKPHHTPVFDANTPVRPAPDPHPGLPPLEKASTPSNRSARPRETVQHSHEIGPCRRETAPHPHEIVLRLRETSPRPHEVAPRLRDIAACPRETSPCLHNTSPGPQSRSAAFSIVPPAGWVVS